MGTPGTFWSKNLSGVRSTAPAKFPRQGVAQANRQTDRLTIRGAARSSGMVTVTTRALCGG
jgi:hypothetical protein